MSKESLKRSIEEIITIAVALTTTVTLIPFSIYRFMQGQYLVAMLEVIGILAIATTGLVVWKTRNTHYTSVVLTALILVGLVGMNYIIGSSILYWVYPAIMTVYFLNSLKISFIAVSTTIVALIPLLIIETSAIQTISVLVTLIITLVFSHIVTCRIRQQHDYLKSLADRDGLTGALNRRSLDSRLDILQNVFFRHKRKGGSIASVIMFDIDNFKSINDNFGHQVGDDILINLSKSIKSYIRKTDEFYRYGGEEFVLVANGANLIKAAELAEKIRILIESSELSSKTTVTASFGVAEIQSLENSTKWLKRADKALYRAKRAGKNRVFLANAEENNYVPEEMNLAIQ